METESYHVTATFVAVCDDGRTYEIEEYTRYKAIQSVGGFADVVELDKHYRTTSGIRVCRLSEDTYGIFDPDVQTGIDAVIARRR